MVIDDIINVQLAQNCCNNPVINFGQMGNTAIRYAINYLRNVYLSLLTLDGMLPTCQIDTLLSLKSESNIV